jgi:hypothetical protein
LRPHTDDAEVTLNVGLCEAFEGGAIAFHGRSVAEAIRASETTRSGTPRRRGLVWCTSGGTSHG